MTQTYDTHCPVCREAITVYLDSDDTPSGYRIVGDCSRECLWNEMEAWCEWADELEHRSPAWWERELQRQQMRRNVASGLQPALPL